MNNSGTSIGAKQTEPQRLSRQCGHPRKPENTCQVTTKRPGGRCRLCKRAEKARYRRSEKGRAAIRRYRALEYARKDRLYQLDRYQRFLAWGQQPQNRERKNALNRACRARNKARLDEIYS